MKFACVEYTTKSGGIWRHTPERPNYLADHQKEIDATSYGTWTSALDGEHVPVSWFIDGKPGPGSGDSFSLQRRISMRWNRRHGTPIVRFDNLEYLENLDVVLVCFHRYGHRLVTEFMEAARERYPDKLILGTHAVFSLGALREAWKDPEWFRLYRKFMDLADVFVTANLEAEHYLGLVSDTPVVYFPQFYPVSYARKHFRIRQDKDRAIFVAGSTGRTDIVWSCLLARQIQRRFPEYIIRVVEASGFNYEALKGADYEVLPRMGWEEYLAATSRAAIILNTDAGWTNGRVQADAAVVGTPCIGVNAGRQTELFPELACRDISDTERALDLAARLLEDSDFYGEIVDRAAKRLDTWSYERAPARLEKLVNACRSGRVEELSRLEES